ncbi:succinylglutamate desuccinylase/aspartoacylase family protein [Natronococcus occultus]|uniref:Putative deacylase n=1 Tax=Natronococcus occultus SP4 TaxID=694430 RepID=L0K2E2_9EURY|nr:succinylglutamate desuccinylase/aspartoacylase family protein [Natronococcus occultus]AGB38720.1 putative deacylase [Natronococcus occultus SP4]
MTNRSSGERATAGGVVSTRRSLLLGAATTVLGGGAVAGSATATEQPSIEETTWTLRSGTRYETPVYVREAAEPGETVVVLGGVHGSELAGIEAAHSVREWSFERGTVVVVPEANAPAVREQTYSGPDGDLNQQFPPEGEPTTPIADAIWSLLVELEPTAVIDMHSSMGIWGSSRGPSGFGQAIFPGVAADARSIAARANRSLNGREIRPSEYGSAYEFTLGNTLAGAHPRLIHKVAVDLECAGYLTEVTRHDTTLETRTEWSEAVAATLLERHGIDVV